MSDDTELLRAYAKDGSEPAFRAVVERHIPLVMATARRIVAGDVHLAQDVTQLVFTDLARKAATLPPGVVLGGWLHRHTCFTAAKAVRTEQRRRARERTAMEINTANEDSARDAHWLPLAPVLDDALNHLDDDDRDALVLRYFEQRDLRAIGAALGISDDTAQKRVARALDKLRAILTRRGITVSTIALATTLDAETAPAVPAAAVAAISAAALSGAAATSTLISTSLFAMKATKTVLAFTGLAALGLLTAVMLTQKKSPDPANALPPITASALSAPATKSGNATADHTTATAPSLTTTAGPTATDAVASSTGQTRPMVAPAMPAVAVTTNNPAAAANQPSPKTSTAKGLQFVTGPANGTEIVQAALSRPNYIRMLGTADLNSLEIKPPLALYRMGLNTIADGGGLETAETIGYEYLIESHGQFAAYATVAENPSGVARLTTFGTGRIIGEMSPALQKLAQLDQIKSGSYEARIIQVSGIFGSGTSALVWLKSATGGPDLIYIPVTPFVAATLTAEKTYTADEFFKLAQSIAQKRIQTNQGARAAVPAP